MKFVRILSRLILISLAAAIFVMLTAYWGNAMKAPPRDLLGEIAREHRPPWPDFSDSITILGEGAALVLYALIGRIVLRLRLSPAPRNEGQLLRLKLE